MTSGGERQGSEPKRGWRGVGEAVTTEAHREEPGGRKEENHRTGSH